MNFIELLLPWCYIIMCLVNLFTCEHISAYELEPDVMIHCCNGTHTAVPNIYCYKASEKLITNVWRSISIYLSLPNEKYKQYVGNTASDVMQEYMRDNSYWSLTSLLPKWTQHISLDPFNSTCIGISTNHDYSLILILTQIDGWLLFKFIFGLVIYSFAQYLSHSQMFYYVCGITCGVAVMMIIPFYFASRMISNRPIFYAVAMSTWSAGCYILQYLMSNIKLILMEYMQYFIIYVVISGIISFVFCYRFGPVSNPRTIKLIQWTLQLAGLVCVYLSSYLKEVYIIICLILVTTVTRFSPLTLSGSFINYMKRKFCRPKLKRLTPSEFDQQGIEETEKALQELKGYCSSPKCDPWKTVLKLKDPSKFASFIEGSSHVSIDEQYDHENTLFLVDELSIEETDDED